MNLRLRNGDRVCIIGGGPAGSFSALHLLRLARQQGLDCEVVIYEAHDFFTPGAVRNCKGCAGILSAGALERMADLGLSLPPQVVQSELRTYEVHVPGQVTIIDQPVAGRKILSVYRGSGPRRHQGDPLASFDGFLLSQAMAAGAQHIRARVRKVTWDGRPIVHTDQADQRADFLVLATGVNSRSPLDPVFGYRPPSSAVMIQDEIWRPDDWPDYRVAGFFGEPRGLLFGALVPKGDYLNVSLLWRGPVAHAIQQFYISQAANLQHFFPTMPQGLCGCSPRILTGPASAYYGDRWVGVGDAVVSHLYKDGIHSAFLTSQAAMSAALECGIGREHFRRTYQPFCDHLAADNRYGTLLYAAFSRFLGVPRCASAFADSVRAEAGLALEQQLHARLLWGMLTGAEPYGDLLRLVLKPSGVLAFGRRMLSPTAVAGQHPA